MWMMRCVSGLANEDDDDSNRVRTVGWGRTAPTTIQTMATRKMKPPISVIDRQRDDNDDVEERRTHWVENYLLLILPDLFTSLSVH